MTTEAFLVRADCGDCGHAGGHVLGVALTEEDAERIKTEAESATETWGTRPKKWIHGVEVDRFPLNELLSGDA